jgi:hypothetical protein
VAVAGIAVGCGVFCGSLPPQALASSARAVKGIRERMYICYLLM